MSDFFLSLERLLHSQGFGTRKACRALARSGQVSVAGKVQSDPFAEFEPTGLEFTVADQVWRYRPQVYVMLNKPAGYECSRSPRHHAGVYELLPKPLFERGAQPVGRLDEDTTGLLLLSDDGQFIHRLISPRHQIAKVYAVTLKHPVTESLVIALRSGVLLRDEAEPTIALACAAVDERLIHLTLGEGKYHQVKRMVAAAGNRVEALKRIRVGGLELPEDLEEGAWRWLEPEDLERLWR
jgi:16S rRNA pseudouridine516 synthase